MSERRQVALAGVAFIATLILLGGLASVIGRADPGTTATPPSSDPPLSSPAGPSPSSSEASDDPSPSASASAGDPVLVGAGDIGDCDTTGDTATQAA